MTARTCIEMFAGAGGLALGVERAGYTHVAVIEWDPKACATLEVNTSWPVVLGDVRSFDFRAYRSQVSLVSGGPPCQPFSRGGRHCASRDPRDMLPVAITAVRDILPRAFLFENVAGLARRRFQGYLGEALKHFADAGYHVQSVIVNAADYGVPQIRRRIFLAGVHRDLGVVWEPPTPTHRKAQWVTVADALADLPDPEWFPYASPFTDHQFQPNARSYPGHTGSPPDRPAKTLKAGVHGVPGGENMLRRPDGAVRYFSVREAARLQTFPDAWQFPAPWTEAMRQIGNAVPVRLAERMARSMAVTLEHAGL